MSTKVPYTFGSPTTWDQTPSHIMRFATYWDPLSITQTYIDLMPEAIGITKMIGPDWSDSLSSEHDTDLMNTIGFASGNSLRFFLEDLNDTINDEGIAIDYSSVIGEIILTAPLQHVINGVKTALDDYRAIVELVEVHSPDQYVYGLLKAYGKEGLH